MGLIESIVDRFQQTQEPLKPKKSKWTITSCKPYREQFSNGATKDRTWIMYRSDEEDVKVESIDGAWTMEDIKGGVNGSRGKSEDGGQCDSVPAEKEKEEDAT